MLASLSQSGSAEEPSAYTCRVTGEAAVQQSIISSSGGEIEIRIKRGQETQGVGRDLVQHDLEEAERAGELAVGPLHEEMRDGAVRHPHLDEGPVVVAQEL